MKVAVDAMGGDAAPKAAVAGAWLAAVHDGIPVLLVGDRNRIEAELSPRSMSETPLEAVHADEVVGMEEPATTPLRRKRRSSIRVCAELVQGGRAAAMVSAGNTGAAMAVAKVILGTVPGVDRPALAAIFPNSRGRTVLLDVGANVDSKPHHLRQFAVMGHFYAQEVLGTRAPRVGLLSIGEEEGKGTGLTREVLRILQNTGLNFLGNVEGRDVFDGSADVVVCDGFVGNALLKASEAMAVMLADLLRDELETSLRTRLGALLARPALWRVALRTDPNQYGAAPLLGVRGGCFVAHGSSTAEGIRNSIRLAHEYATAAVHDKIRERMALMHSHEEEVFGRSGRGATAEGPRPGVQR